mgnify:CR=1 FL=1
MNRSLSFKTLSHLVCCVVLCAAPALAVDSALGGGGRAVAPAISLDAPLAGVNWIDTAGRQQSADDWKDWVGKRAQSGRLAPRGFNKNGKFVG